MFVDDQTRHVHFLIIIFYHLGSNKAIVHLTWNIMILLCPKCLLPIPPLSIVTGVLVNTWHKEAWLSYITPSSIQTNTVNTLRLRQIDRKVAVDIFKWISLNENVWILLKISLKFAPTFRINNFPALVQINAWRRQGDKPLSVPMTVSLRTHMCVTGPQWVNTPSAKIFFYPPRPCDAFMHRRLGIGLSSV